MLSEMQSKDIINIFDGKKIGNIIDISVDKTGKIIEMIVQRKKFK